jgi:hypothetical protein
MSTRPDSPSSALSPPVAGLLDRLASVLGDLTFPAQRWQVITVGDLYGVDTSTRSLLERLPQRRYHSLREVAAVLAAVLSGRPVASVGQAGPPPTPRVAPRHTPAAARPQRVVGRRPVPTTPVA